MLNLSNSIKIGCAASLSVAMMPMGLVVGDMDAAVALVLAKAALKGRSSVVTNHWNTTSQLNLPATFPTKNYMLSEPTTAYPARHVTSQEDLILRRASMRASKLIAKGRLITA